MDSVRKTIGGVGNLLFKQSYLMGQVLDGVIPDVYVQSSEYWSKHREQIRSAFSGKIGSKDLTALHLRRGDYVDTDFHVKLWETDYYKKAVEFFPSTERFLVFYKDNQGKDDEDRLWCAKFMTDLVGSRWSFAPSETSETEDLNLMASCKNIIMANSSFSWWAAFLGIHKVIICPKNWFTDGIQRTELLNDWILI